MAPERPDVGGFLLKHSPVDLQGSGGTVQTTNNSVFNYRGGNLAFGGFNFNYSPTFSTFPSGPKPGDLFYDVLTDTMYYFSGDPALGIDGWVALAIGGGGIQIAARVTSVDGNFALLDADGLAVSLINGDIILAYGYNYDATACPAGNLEFFLGANSLVASATLLNTTGGFIRWDINQSGTEFSDFGAASVHVGDGVYTAEALTVSVGGLDLCGAETLQVYVMYLSGGPLLTPPE